MKQLNSFISEKLKLSKDLKINSKELIIDDTTIMFPVKVIINNTYEEKCINYRLEETSHKQKKCLFIGESGELVFGCLLQSAKLIFIDNERILCKTKYGYKFVEKAK